MKAMWAVVSWHEWHPSWDHKISTNVILPGIIASNLVFSLVKLI